MHPSADAKADGILVTVARSIAEIEALGPHWRALEARTASPSFFQSYAWCRHVLATRQTRFECGPIRPFVLASWQSGMLVAVWPLQRPTESGTVVLKDLSSPFGQYADILVADDIDGGIGATGAVEQLCLRLIAEAHRLSRADALALTKVRSDTPLGRALARSATPLGDTQHAPFVSMAGFPTFEAFHASTKAKTRKNVRNATHRLEKLGKVSHKVERRSATMHDAIRRCFDLRSDWLETKGQISTAFADPAFPALIEGLARPHSHEVDVLSMMLMLDDEPISIHYGFVHNRRYYAYMAARNPKYDACSPGKVHLEHVMRACFAEGVEVVDLLAPEMPYKMVWTQDTVETRDYGLTWSWRGWLAIDLWRRRLRPAALKAFGAMPAFARRTFSRALRSRRGTDLTAP